MQSAALQVGVSVMAAKAQLSGTLFRYGSKNVQVAFRSGDFKKQVIFLGGLTDGLLATDYVEPLANALLDEKWSLVQPLLSSSYTGYGQSSLTQDSTEIEQLIYYLINDDASQGVMLMGHSTGCQNIVHYLRRGSSCSKAVRGAILQVPVDRFLSLLQRHDWVLAPLIVDVNGSITPTDEEAIMSQFNKLNRDNRSGCEGSAMYIATAYDLCSQTWTRECPNNKGLKRLVAYAKSSAALLTNMITSQESSLKWQTLFRTPLNCYDALVLLHEQSLPHPSRVLFPAELVMPAVVTKQTTTDVLAKISPTVMKAGALAARNHVLIGFDPVDCYVKDLRERLSESFSIFYDHLGSDVLGLTWTTTSTVKREGEEKVGGEIDVNAVIKHLSEAGDGLVKSIHLSDKVRKGHATRSEPAVVTKSKKVKRRREAEKVSKKKKT